LKGFDNDLSRENGRVFIASVHESICLRKQIINDKNMVCDFLIVDDSHRISEIDLLCSIEYCRPGKLVLLGDRSAMSLSSEGKKALSYQIN